MRRRFSEPISGYSTQASISLRAASIVNNGRIDVWFATEFNAVDNDDGSNPLQIFAELDTAAKAGDYNARIGVCTSLPTTPHLVVGRSACRVGVGPSLNRSWAQRSRPVVQAGRRAFPGDESVVD